MKTYTLLLLLFFAGLIISAIQPHDYFTWFLEVLPALIGCAVLVFTFSMFKFSLFVYVLILLHCFVLFIGAHYTYAEVPFFNWIKDTLGMARNNYDKVGHFAQGFVPAAIIRELFIRKNVLKKRRWLPFLVLCCCVFISVLYEFLEWGVALLTGESADAFLGTQGYAWDTQSDMLFACIGALTFLIIFSGYHNRVLRKMNVKRYY